MKLTEKQLKEMVRKVVKAKLQEATEKEMPDSWVAYMKEVEDLFAETIDKMKELAEKGEKMKAEERELDKTANPINSARKNHYEYIDERSVALKDLAANLSQKLETWRTKYRP